MVEMKNTGRPGDAGDGAKETGRQLFHMAVGLVALLMLLALGRGFTMAAVFFVIIIGMLLMNARLLGRGVSVVRWFEERFERENAPLPGWGSACYAAGALLLLAFLTDANGIAAGIFILAVGDSASTMVGRLGTHAIPYNKGKTFEGALAFFIASLASAYFIGPLAVPLAMLAACVETLPGLEDNLAIPVACTAFLLVF
jgi:dolichol kinase